MPLQNDPIGNGMKYPFQISSGGVAWSGAPKGLNNTDKYRVQVVRQSILQIVFTVLKEMVMNRPFGSTIHDIPFDTLVDARALLERRVVAAINKFEKRVINVRMSTELIPDEGRIDVSLTYTIISIGSADTMTFPWYLEDSGV